MTQGYSNMPNVADMSEAARLIRAGRLEEATALIRRRATSAPATDAASGVAGRSAADREKDPEGYAAQAALLPEWLRHALGNGGTKGLGQTLGDALGRALRGLREGAAPNFDDLGLDERPRGRAPCDERLVERSFSNEAGSLDYKLFIPSSARSEAANGAGHPLVVMLHGCTQSPDDFAAGTGMNAVAEEHGAFVAYPRQGRRANAQKCWNWFEVRHQGREQGESGIIAGLTRAIVAEHGIDPRRVYIAGLSAGGAAAANIARAYPDLYAAVGVHSGLAAGCARDLGSALMAMNTGAPGAELPGGSAGFGGGSATQAVRVPTIVFHGSDDGTVNPRNAEEVLVQAGIADLTPRREGRTAAGGRAYTRTRYLDALGRAQVEAWRVDGAGHAWSGGSKAGSYTDPQGPDASRAMLDFFMEHRLGPQPS